MRTVTFSFVCFATVVAVPGSGWAQQADQWTVTESDESSEAVAEPAAEPTAAAPGMCANIGCSGHGKCAVLDGRPTCACDDGFRADPTNGLGCLPLAAVEAVAPKTTAEATKPDRNVELAKVEAIVGGINLASHYTDYLKGSHGAKSFLDYEAMRYSRKKAANGALATFGTIILLGSTPFFFCTAFAWPFVFPAIGCIGVGLAMIIPGAVMHRKNRGILERLQLYAAPGAVAFRF